MEVVVNMLHMGQEATHGARSNLTANRRGRKDASQNDYTTTRYRNGRHVDTIPRRNE